MPQGGPPNLAAETAEVTAEAEEAGAAVSLRSLQALASSCLFERAKRRYVECFDPLDDPYDPLLDPVEPGMMTVEVRTVFDQLEQQLAIAPSSAATDNGEDEFMPRLRSRSSGSTAVPLS